jgi:outer membrane protein assembly factor BamD
MARNTMPYGRIRSLEMTSPRNTTLRAAILILATLFAGLFLAGCRGKQVSSQSPGASAEPDKVLYERAAADIERNRFEEARLALQTLINTYPDSEYLAKAKLGLADSYFREGGPTALTQAIAEYQDFLTFFPFLDEAAYAQLQIGMAHYRQMAKPDRDRNDTLEAEGALQTFLQKYPTSPLFPQAQQRLREVQEVIAEGDFRVANFYYLRGTTRASAARLFELVNRYPLYSQADKANWMLANLAERGERNDVAGQYAVIIKNYPLSPLAKDAQAKLVKFGVPVPQPDSAAMARMQTEQQTPRKRGGILSMPLGMLRSSPDVSMAARTGAPTLTPRQVESGDVMAPGAASSLGAASASSGTPGLGAVVETVTPGSGNSVAVPATSVTAGTGSTVPPPPAATTGEVPAAASTTDSSTANGATTAPPASSGESSSKKKKGLRKIIPW